MSMRLGKMMIFVTDLREAKRFYCEVLGFPLKQETENSLEFLHKGCDLITFKCEKKSNNDDYGNQARSIFVFKVKSIEKKMTELINKDVEFLHKIPAENDFSRYAAFYDPFNNVHEIYEPK